eukprot:5507916-Amphidinium_carterae.1
MSKSPRGLRSWCLDVLYVLETALLPGWQCNCCEVASMKEGPFRRLTCHTCVVASSRAVWIRLR